MSILPDYGLEVIRKAGEVYNADPGSYLLRVRNTEPVRISGLSSDFKVTTMDVTTAAAKMPLIPLANRNSLSIFNLSEDFKIYVGQTSSVTADSVLGATSGWEIPPLGTLNVDITNGIELYAVATTTVRVKVLELA